ncbi:hypothetical protein ACWEQ8_41685 [Streptomyces noursei]
MPLEYGRHYLADQLRVGWFQNLGLAHWLSLSINLGCEKTGSSASIMSLGAAQCDAIRTSIREASAQECPQDRNYQNTQGKKRISLQYAPLVSQLQLERG